MAGMRSMSVMQAESSCSKTGIQVKNGDDYDKNGEKSEKN